MPTGEPRESHSRLVSPMSNGVRAQWRSVGYVWECSAGGFDGSTPSECLAPMRTCAGPARLGGPRADAWAASKSRAWWTPSRPRSCGGSSRENGVVRGAAWYRWRYLDAVPKWEVLGAWEAGRLVGAVAFHLDDDRRLPSGLIGEVVGVRFEVLRVLLGRCCQELRAMGAVRAAVLVQPGRLLEQVALATAFLPRRATFSVEAVDLGGGLPLAAHFQGGDFDAV